MRGWWGISVYMLSLVLAVQTAHAQSRNDGYDKPDVEINRSVLQELKDYTPPPMFGADAPLTSPPVSTPAPAPLAPPKIRINDDNNVKVEDKGNGRKTYTITNTTKSSRDVTAPTRPTLTAPKAEDILAHPVENFHVLTIQQPALTQPDPKSALPVPAAPPAKATKNSGERLTIIAPPPKKPKVAPPMLPPAAYINTKPKQKTVAAPVPLPPKVTPKPYVPKSAKSMPAVGAVKVEKAVLPPTPSLTPSAPPSPTDKLVDAALETHMVEDNEAVKDAVIAKPDKNKKKDSSEPKVAAPSNMAVFSLAFTDGATELNTTQKSILKSNAIMLLNQDKKKRINILAYAASENDDEGAARRASLARALSVRQYLVDNNIPPARIDLKALGNATKTTPKDRVDIKVK